MREYARPHSSRWTRTALGVLPFCYRYALFLGVINFRYDAQQMRVHQVKKRRKVVAIILRLILIGAYSSVIPNLYAELLGKLRDHALILTNLQATTMSFFAFFLFVMQTRHEVSITALMNRFIELYQRVSAATALQPASILSGKFVVLVTLKMLATLLGYLNEIPQLMRENRTSLIGIYIWMGSMYMLDACFLGFLVISLLYEQLGRQLCDMLQRMQRVERHGEAADDTHLTDYQRMQLLCDFADHLDACGTLYAELYSVAQRFNVIFQWQILYYIYYNFMVILLMLHKSIWLYLHEAEEIDWLGLAMVAVKIVNLLLLVMCADAAVQKSLLPERLALDVVCSDMDGRWDMSVESFLSHRKVENLEIKVLGFFHLDNGFILLILSAIISYLFILIQFGMTGAYSEPATEAEGAKGQHTTMASTAATFAPSQHI